MCVFMCFCAYLTLLHRSHSCTLHFDFSYLRTVQFGVIPLYFLEDKFHFVLHVLLCCYISKHVWFAWFVDFFMVDGSIKVWELNFAGPVPDEGDHPTELEGNRGIDDTCNDPKTFEAIDDKECQDNGCNPLMVKWLAKMKGDVSRSRLVCREIKKAKNKDEQLGPEDVFSPMPLSVV